MTTKSWVSPIYHSTDAEFRAWAAEISAALSDVGMIKTSDTGQIDFSTAIRPVVSAAAGYEIWRFNDSLQSTAPIFIKIEYGSNNTTTPKIWITVGTGSDGAGVITGATVARAELFYYSGFSPGSYPSYVCAADGFLGVAIKIGASGTYGTGLGFFCIARSHDYSGSPTSRGFSVYNSSVLYNNPAKSNCVRSAAPETAYAQSTAHSIVPGQPTSSLDDDGNPQIYPHFGICPEVYVLPVLGTVVVNDVPSGTVFNASIVGTVARTFISLGCFNPFNIVVGPGVIKTYGFAMLWE